LQSAVSRMGRVVSHQSEETVGKFHCRPSTVADVQTIAENMRTEDVDEIKAQSGNTPREGLFFCYFMSKPCVTIVSRHGNPIGMWGVVPLDNTAGRIWMLGCEAMLKDASDKYNFLRESRKELAKLHGQYPLLTNVVDARNTVHVRWIRWMGFTFIKKHPQWGPEHRMFYEFVRI